MTDLHITKAVFRLNKALVRAEAEYPLLAAPDGTVSVSITDLKAVLNDRFEMAEMLALGRQEWIAEWCGSPPGMGSTIRANDRRVVAYLGGDEDTHALAGQIVMAHNASLSAREAVKP